MLTFEIKPMELLSHKAARFVRLASDASVSELAGFFQPRNFVPCAQETIPLKEVDRSWYDDDPQKTAWRKCLTGKTVDDCSALPKVVIDQLALLRMACYLSVMPRYEFMARCATERQGNVYCVRDIRLVPRQLVSQTNVFSSTSEAELLAHFAGSLDKTLEEARDLFSAEIHSHVSMSVEHSDEDFALLFQIAAGDHLPGYVSPKEPGQWLSIIANRKGELRLAYVDFTSRLFTSDLPWEMGSALPGSQSAKDWIRRNYGSVVEDMRTAVRLWPELSSPVVAIPADLPSDGEVEQGKVDVPVSVPVEQGNVVQLKPGKRLGAYVGGLASGLAVAAVLVLGVGLFNLWPSSLPFGPTGSGTVAVAATPASAPAPLSTAPKEPTGPSVVLATTPAPVTVPVPVVTPPVTPAAPAQVVAVALPAATQEPAPGESVAPTAPAVTATTPVAAKPTTEELAERFKGVTRPERIWPEYERFSKVPTSMLKQFGGMTTEEFYAWRDEHPKERRRVPLVVDEAFMEGDEARRPDMHCRVCGSGEHIPFCDQYVDKRDLQEACDRGARFLGDEEKPLRKVLEQRLEEKAAKEKAKASQ